jgi:hypothetical protein
MALWPIFCVARSSRTDLSMLVRRLDETPPHQSGVPGRRQNKKRHTAPYEQSTPAISLVISTPQSDRRVHYEHQEQERAQFAKLGPFISNALRHGDRLSSQSRQVPQTGDPLIIRRREKVNDQGQQPQTADSVAEPRAPRAEMKPHESDDRNNPAKNWKVRPPDHFSKLVGGLRMHCQQFTRSDRRHRDGGGREHKASELPGLLEPDHQVHYREGETRGGHHRPGDRRPAHGKLVSTQFDSKITKTK